ncbi:type IV pilus twitching motility protein PilT [candidate division CSSED10-310 bacterium]|uniref:Type IV pilus twitching motility protein PilT n=1 Tax=candidate division CSSED10-310 bacterium TaxID=2855610 RepID=A0ABV6YYS9_UNCC1
MDFNGFLASLLKLSPGNISDLHFKVGSPPLLRINGVIRNAKFRPLTAEDTQKIALLFLEDEELLMETNDLDTAYNLPTGQRFRVNLFRQRGTLSIVLRVIPPEIPTIESLGLPEVLKEICQEERGMVLVTGVTGSGKSSTLAAMVRQINEKRRAHILTIEDPIEFVHEDNLSSINQREVGTDTDTFATALKKALRQDPDIILVGEMRDLETIEIAMKAAETGHLLLSTLHTTDVSKTINRIIDVFPSAQHVQVRYQLSANLQAIISQRLLPLKDGRGRIAAVEVMRSTESIKAAIEDPTKTAEIKDFIRQGQDVYHTQTFDQHLTQLFQSGKITREVAIAASTNPADFERAMAFE